MSIEDDISQYLVDQNTVPTDAVFLYYEPIFAEGEVPTTVDITYVIIPEIGTDNPKFTRGSQFLTFRIRGRNKSLLKTCKDEADKVYNKLLGSPSVQIGNNIYFQFNASEVVRFAGFYEGSEPIFTFTLNVTKESLVDIGNRQTF